jgi:hypothetical protein
VKWQFKCHFSVYLHPIFQSLIKIQIDFANLVFHAMFFLSLDRYQIESEKIVFHAMVFIGLDRLCLLFEE